MIKKRGGHETPFKEKGRMPVEKQRQVALRRLAMDGIGFNADGNAVKGLVGEAPNNLGINGQERMGRSIHFGYKFQRVQGRRIGKVRKEKEKDSK